MGDGRDVEPLRADGADDRAAFPRLRTEAEDVAQEVFLAVFRKAKTIRDPDSLRSFIYSFAVRVLKAELRRRKIRGWLPFMPEAPLDFGFLTWTWRRATC